MQDDCPTFAPGESKDTILFQVQRVLDLWFPLIRRILVEAGAESTGSTCFQMEGTAA
jgi:hypothetical protein